MNRKNANILMAYAFHVIFVVMSFLMMQHYYDGLQTIFLAFGSIYLIYWIISNRKKRVCQTKFAHPLLVFLLRITSFQLID